MLLRFEILENEFDHSSSNKREDFIVSNQFTYNGYRDYGLNYNYPNNQDNFYRYAFQSTRAPLQVGDRVRINPTAQYFVNGQPIPSSYHNTETYIQEINVEGTELLLYGITDWLYAVDVTSVMPSVYNVNVVNGTGDGTFPQGTRVDISATPPASQRFVNWTVTAGGVTLADYYSPNTYFTLGNEDVIVTANLEDIPATSPTTPAPPTIPVQSRAVNVLGGFGGGFFPVGRRVEILATPVDGKRFLNWTVNAGGITLADANNAHTYFTLGNQDVVITANLEDLPTTQPPTPPTTQPPTTPIPTPIRVGDQVKVNQGVRTWATGEGMPSWVHGRTYPVIEIRTRNGVTELLLGNGINSWIRASDVTRVSETTSTPIQISDQVKVNQGVRTWATGEGMPSWVHGRTYPVIEIRTRSGVTELLLGNGINSWIRLTDVTRVSGTANNPIQINNRVRVNQGVRTWATGEGMPSWVHGRIYPVIEIRTRGGNTELLLGDINSWIRQTDVTKV